VRQAADENIIRRMRFACWISKGTNTSSEYLKLFDFQQQKRLLERTSMLRFTYFVSIA